MLVTRHFILATLLLLLPPTRTFALSSHQQQSTQSMQHLAVDQQHPSTFVEAPPQQLQLPTPQRKKRKPSTRQRRTFEYRLQQLKNYKSTYGTCLVDPAKHFDLSLWTKTIRLNYRHQTLNKNETSIGGGRRPSLRQDKLKQLNDVGFVWNVQGVTWQARFEELKAFKAQNGHFNIPLDHPTLGIWVRNQKRDFRNYMAKRATGLTLERYQLLDDIGFWNSYISRSSGWDRRYEQLRAFHQQYGHANVPEDYEDNYSLGQWVMNQRLWYKRYLAGLSTALTPQRITLLEQVNFTWSFQTYAWCNMLKRLKDYQTEHDSLKISTSDPSNQDLRIWLIHQRHGYACRNDSRPTFLTEQRIEALEQIPNFKWKGRNAREGLTVADWAALFEGIKEKGITANSKAKQHWFDGQNPFEEEFKETLSDEDLIDLWNQEEDDD